MSDRPHMINMNAFASFDFFDKQIGAPSFDAAETEANAKEFDGLLTTLVAPPSGGLPVSKTLEENFKSAAGSVQFPEPDDASPKKKPAIETPILSSSPTAQIATSSEIFPPQQSAPPPPIAETSDKLFADTTNLPAEENQTNEDSLPFETKAKPKPLDKIFAPDEATRTNLFEQNFSREASTSPLPAFDAQPHLQFADFKPSPEMKSAERLIFQSADLQRENSQAPKFSSESAERTFSPATNAPLEAAEKMPSQTTPQPILVSENHSDPQTNVLKTSPTEPNSESQILPENESSGAPQSDWQNVKIQSVFEDVSDRPAASVKPAAPVADFARLTANDFAPEPPAELTAQFKPSEKSNEPLDSTEIQTVVRPKIKLAAPDEEIYAANFKAETKLALEEIIIENGGVGDADAENLSGEIDSAVEPEQPREAKNVSLDLATPTPTPPPEKNLLPEPVSEKISLPEPTRKTLLFFENRANAEPSKFGNRVGAEFIQFENKFDFKIIESESLQTKSPTNEPDFFVPPRDLRNGETVAPESKTPSKPPEKKSSPETLAPAEQLEKTFFSAIKFSSNSSQKKISFGVPPAAETSAHPAIPLESETSHVSAFLAVQSSIAAPREDVNKPELTAAPTASESTIFVESNAAPLAAENRALEKPTAFENAVPTESAAPRPIFEGAILPAANVRPATFANVLALASDAPTFEAIIPAATKRFSSSENQMRPKSEASVFAAATISATVVPVRSTVRRSESDAATAVGATVEPKEIAPGREACDEDGLPILQPPPVNFKRNVFSPPPPQLEVFAPSTVPGEFKNLIHFTNPVGEISASAPVTAADSAPVAAAEAKKYLSEEFPQIFRANSGAPESTKAAEQSPRVEPTVNLKIEIEPSNVQESPSPKSANAPAETAIGKIEKQIEKPSESAENSPAVFFERLALNVGKESKTVEAAAPRSVESAAFFEQIEEPLLQAAMLDAQTDEPEILKLRLRPAELGAIEIRLEKTDAKTINVHLQTETDTARQVLAETVEQLKIALQNSGWQVERMEISAQPTLSSNGGSDSREQQSRQPSAEHSAKARTSFGGNADEPDDLKPNASNRLLSVRA